MLSSTVEGDLESFRYLNVDVQEFRNSSEVLTTKLKQLEAKHHDLENRSRSYNLILFELEDEPRET